MSPHRQLTRDVKTVGDNFLARAPLGDLIVTRRATNVRPFGDVVAGMKGGKVQGSDEICRESFLTMKTIHKSFLSYPCCFHV